MLEGLNAASKRYHRLGQKGSFQGLLSPLSAFSRLRWLSYLFRRHINATSFATRVSVPMYVCVVWTAHSTGIGRCYDVVEIYTSHFTFQWRLLDCLQYLIIKFTQVQLNASKHLNVNRTPSTKITPWTVITLVIVLCRPRITCYLPLVHLIAAYMIKCRHST